MSELKGLLEQFLSSADAPPDLFTTTDWDTLVGMWEAVSQDISRRLVVEWRMSAALSELSDLDILIDLRMKAPSASVQMLIVGRIGRILPSILPHVDRWDVLVKIKRNIQSGSVAEQLVARRMRELLPGILPHTDDWSTLVKLWKAVPNGSRAEQLVELRMVEVIFAVSTDNVPEWFMRYLKSPESIPSQHLAIHFCEKTRTLLADL